MIDAKIAAELAPAEKRIAELERAAKAGTIMSWKIDARAFKATPFMADDSTGPVLDLRPYLQQYHDEVGGVS